MTIINPQSHVQTGRIHRSTTNNRLSLTVDVRRLRTWKVVLAILFAAGWGFASASIPLQNPASAPRKVSQEAIVRPLESGGAAVETYYNWATPYNDVIMWLQTGDRALTDLTGSTPAGPATIEQVADTTSNIGQYQVTFPMPAEAPVQGRLNYTVAAGSGGNTFDVVVQPNSLSAVEGDFDDRSLFRVSVVGYELTDIQCFILDQSGTPTSSCLLSPTESGLYQLELPGSDGEPIQIVASRGAPVPSAVAAPLDAPVAETDSGPGSSTYAAAVAAAFAALVGMWVWWAVRRGGNDYRTGGMVTRVSDGYLYRQATPTLHLPDGIAPYQGRALANERITRMVALTHIADLIGRGVFSSAVDYEGAVAISRGPGYTLATPFDQHSVDRLLEVGDPRTLKSGARQFAKRCVDLNRQLTEQVATVDWWRHGNPAFRRPTRLGAVGVFASIVAWFGLLVGMMVYTTGTTRAALALVWGWLFVMMVVDTFVIYRLLPSLTAEGSRRLVAIESLRQGLQQVTDQQLLAFAAEHRLSEYAAWSVALNVPRVDKLLQGLVQRYPDDGRLAVAYATSRCVRNRAREAAGMATWERMWGWRYWNNPEGSGSAY